MKIISTKASVANLGPHHLVLPVRFLGRRMNRFITWFDAGAELRHGRDDALSERLKPHRLPQFSSYIFG